MIAVLKRSVSYMSVATITAMEKISYIVVSFSQMTFANSIYFFLDVSLCISIKEKKHECSCLGNESHLKNNKKYIEMTSFEMQRKYCYFYFEIESLLTEFWLNANFKYDITSIFNAF